MREGQPIRIAVASSGLAHIKRGVETWAEDLGIALRRNGVDATTFQGTESSNGPSGTVVGCWKRFDPKTDRLVKRLQGKGGWRIGLGNGYGVEQTTFAMGLFPKIRASYDILHVQDPWLGLVFDRLNRAGLSRPRVIMAHGTEEDASELKKYSYLQHLAPNYLEQWAAEKPARQMAFAIPNFVDLDRFRPVRNEAEKRAARMDCGLPEQALVVLSVGALKKVHKRMDYVLREFGRWQHQSPGVNAVLVIAGAREADTDEILSLAKALPAGTVKIVENAARSQVAELLRAADIFTLASLHEMMPIAVLEAMASGLPIACNDTPTLRWMVGDAGPLTVIEEPGALAAQFALLADAGVRRRMATAARERAEQVFSERVVVQQIVSMYEKVLGR